MSNVDTDNKPDDAKGHPEFKPNDQKNTDRDPSKEDINWPGAT